MKHFPGQRMGQSTAELVTVVVLSCMIHILLLSGVIFLYSYEIPRKHLRVAYQVQLVGQPHPVRRTRSGRTAAVRKPKTTQRRSAPPKAQPPPPKKAAPKPSIPEPKVVKNIPKPHKPEPKAAKAGASSKSTPKKSAPSKAQPTPAKEPVKSAKATIPQPDVPDYIPDDEETMGAQSDTISIASSDERFASKHAGYMTILLEKIGMDWRPLLDVRDASVRVVFTINRQGRILRVSIDEKETTGSPRLRMQAQRHILELKALPPLPTDFPGQSAEFSVDMMAKK